MERSHNQLLQHQGIDPLRSTIKVSNQCLAGGSLHQGNMAPGRGDEEPRKPHDLMEAVMYSGPVLPPAKTPDP